MKNKSLIYSIFILIISIFIYSFKFNDAIFYHPDLSRDFYEVLKITQGDLTLLGPKLTFGGLYTGPYYFYLFTPVFFIFKANILSFYIFNMLLYIFAVVYFFNKSSSAFGLKKALIATCSLILLPIYIIGSRNPSNAYSFIPLLTCLLTFIYFNKLKKKLTLTILGFLYGIIINFHFINIVLFPLIIALVWNKIEHKKNIIFFLIGIFLSFLPLIFFEIKNNFVMIKNTFIDKSYLKWIDNKNIPGNPTGKKNVFSNIFFMSSELKSLTYINALIIFAFLGIIGYFSKIKKTDWILFWGSFIALILFSSIVRFQFIPHYLFALGFAIFLTLLIILLNTKYYWFILILIIIQIIFFPKGFYKQPERKPERFEKAVLYVIKNHLINKNDKFNVIQITKEQYLATLGFEYRFFLTKYGYKPLSEFYYPQSNILLVFSEIPNLNIIQFNSCEASQFGKEYFKNAKKYNIDELSIYKIEKR